MFRQRSVRQPMRYSQELAWPGAVNSAAINAESQARMFGSIGFGVTGGPQWYSATAPQSPAVATTTKTTTTTTGSSPPGFDDQSKSRQAEGRRALRRKQASGCARPRLRSQQPTGTPSSPTRSRFHRKSESEI